MPAKELKGFCQDYPQKSDATTMCIGFIWGSFDSARAPKAACERVGVSSRRLISLAIKHLKAHPKQLKLSATALIMPLAALVTSTALAADADNGRRVAETRCVTCHIVAPTQRRDVTDAPPFEVIARKFAATPEVLAFAILDPHPRMNVTLTRREAQDIAAYINALAK